MIVLPLLRQVLARIIHRWIDKAAFVCANLVIHNPLERHGGRVMSQQSVDQLSFSFHAQEPVVVQWQSQPGTSHLSVTHRADGG